MKNLQLEKVKIAANVNSYIIASCFCEKDETCGQQCQMFCKLMLNNN